MTKEFKKYKDEKGIGWKKKAFKLSEKFVTLEEIEKDQQLFIKAWGEKENTWVVFGEDIKEFIQLLKEEFERYSIDERHFKIDCEVIDKLTGFEEDK